MNNKGFTLIELLIVIAILGVLAAAISSNFFGTRNRIVFESQVAKIAADLQATRERSRVQEGGNQWGVHFENPTGAGADFYDIWYGTSYASGTAISHSELTSSVEFTTPGSSSTLDIIFLKATGLPTASSTIVLQSLPLGLTATISVSAQGIVEYSIIVGGGGGGGASAPSVTTNSADPVGTSTATLNGSVNPNGTSTTGWFRYNSTNPGGCNDAFGTSTIATALGSGTSSVLYSQGITGLPSASTTFYCAIAENSVGKSFGSIISFTTTSGGPSNNAPVVSSVTDSPTPVDIGTSISFDIAWSDADLDSAKGIVCKTDSVTAGATPSCPGTEWAGPSASTANGTNINLSFIPTFNDLGLQNYHVFVCDPTGDCSPTTDPNDGTFDVKAGLIPGTIEAENYNLGGEGVGYHDLDIGNNGDGTCRTDDVDHKNTTDVGGGCTIGWFDTAEWLQYDVNIAVAGTYLLEVRIAQGNAATTTFYIEQDGIDVTGPVSVGPTGGWETFATIQHPGVSLSAGNHTLRLVSDNFFDINWMRWSTSTTSWYNASWQYRKKITVQSSQVDANVTNFPVYVDLSDLGSDFFTKVKSDGGDIRITKGDALIELPREVVVINTAGNTGELHFKADSLSSSAPTDFYIYYGNSGATEPSANSTYGSENTWDANYKGVWHLQEEQAGVGNFNLYKDSTSNNNDGDDEVSATDQTGKVGAGQEFDGDNDRIDISAADIIPPWTAEFWVNRQDSANSNATLMDTGGSFALRLEQYNNTNKVGYTKYGVADYVFSPTYTAPTSMWTHLVFVGTDSANVSLYVNGALYATNAAGIDLPMNTIGRSSGSIKGLLDEVRASNIGRASTWISTEYNNQNSPSTFYSVGS